MSDLPLRTIGIIGAGQMGGGIAHVAAQSGFEVRLADISQDQKISEPGWPPQSAVTFR